jgi:hypothetical protein
VVTLWENYRTELLSSPQMALPPGHTDLPLEEESATAPSRRREDRGAGRVADRLIVLGEPGSGKSCALVRLAARLLEPSRADRVTPLLVPLKTWDARPLEGDPVDPLDSFIVRVLRNRFQSLASLAVDALRSDRASLAVLLDGFDEIRDPAARHLFVRTLTERARPWRQVIIAGRRYGYTQQMRQMLEAANFECREIRPLSPELKRRILERRLGKWAAESALSAVRNRHRLERLTDNPLMLSIVAENSSSLDQSSRGAILSRYVMHAMTQIQNGAPTDLVHRFLEELSARMRDTRTGTLTDKDCRQIAVRVLESRDDGLKPHDLLDGGLHTRLIRREGLLEPSIDFALPQYEEFFLAHRSVKELCERLENRSLHRSVLDLPLVKDAGRHHELILAAGLIGPDRLNTLIGLLPGREHTLLKARILADAAAPEAEARLIRELTHALRKRVDFLSGGLARLGLSLLVAWGLGFLALGLSSLYVDDRRKEALWTSLVIAWAVGAPVCFRFLLPLLGARVQTRLKERVLPEALAALLFLSNEAVVRRLQELVYDLERRAAWARKGDPLAKLLAAAAERIRDVLTLSMRDTDTVLSELEESPSLLAHWLGLPTAALSERDVTILCAAILREELDEQLRLDCLRKLAEVARASSAYRPRIRDTFVQLEADTNRRVAQAAHSALKRIDSEHVPDTLRSSAPRLRILAVGAVLSLTGMVFFTHRFAEGGNLVQQMVDYKALYLLWVLVLVFLLAKWARPGWAAQVEIMLNYLRGR